MFINNTYQDIYCGSEASILVLAQVAGCLEP